MTKQKTSALIGPALDWAVAKCEGRRVEYNHQYTDEKKFDGWWQLGPNHWQPLNKSSTDWSQGGPIIEREGMHVDCLRQNANPIWEAWPYATGTKHIYQGPTPLIAAMRCYVASKLGDIVDIPDNLV